MLWHSTATQTQTADFELVQGEKEAFEWFRRRNEPQGKTHYEKSLRFQNSEMPSNRLISRTWQVTRT